MTDRPEERIAVIDGGRKYTPADTAHPYEIDRADGRWTPRCRQFACELDRYTDDEVKTVAAAIAVAEDARKQRESSP